MLAQRRGERFDIPEFRLRVAQNEQVDRWRSGQRPDDLLQRRLQVRRAVGRDI